MIETNEQLKKGTPCKGVCSTTYDEICKGCGRTVDEVSNWSILNEQERSVIWDRIISKGYYNSVLDGDVYNRVDREHEIGK